MVTASSPAVESLEAAVLRPVAPLAPEPQPTPALDQALQAVGDRWSLAIVARLVAGPLRFNDLATVCKPIARTVLSDRLRKLEESGVVARRKYSDTPARYNYRLTVAGAELARVCGVLADWASRNLAGSGAALTHRECGHDVMPSYSCTACGPIAARDVDANF